MILRLVARLDIKGPNVVKGVRMEGLRVVGKPAELATRYAEYADEILYVDTVASLYGRNALAALIEETAERVFIPITVMGGISSTAEAQRLLNAGADSVAVNTAGIRNPRLIQELSDHYGSQAITVAIDAKERPGGWECLTDGGRETTGKSAQAWADEVVKLGAGCILVTSVDRDGTRQGFDIPLIKAIAGAVDVPVIGGGGMGSVAHLRKMLTESQAAGASMASVLHSGAVNFKEMHNVVREEFASGKLRHAGPGRAGGEAGRSAR